MKSPQITWISASDPPEAFPDVERAFDIPDGLLAAGGDLSEPRILYAYCQGIFPWFSEGQPILWWSPDPRCVIRPEALRISRRLARAFRNSGFEITFNRAFDDVIARCAADRPGQDGTWITPAMHTAYRQLHNGGWAHSIEVWGGERLVGGLYGLAIGRVFFGESMFSTETNASKAAMRALCRVLIDNDFGLLDCQVESPHLLSMGAELMPRSRFVEFVEASCAGREAFNGWPLQRRPVGEFAA